MSGDSVITGDLGVNTLGVTTNALIVGRLDVDGFTQIDDNVEITGDLGVNTLGVTTNATIVGDLTVDTNTFIVDSSADNVGIGLTNPAYKLDVSGDINFTGVLYQDGTTFTSGGGSSNWTVEGDDIYNNNNDNVGIGLTNPAYKLDVSGDINTSTALRIEGIDIETVFNIIQVENKKTYFNSFLTLGGTNLITGDYSGGVTEFIYTNASSTQTLFVSNIVVSIKDDGPFNLSQFGGLGTTASNGINIYYTGTSGAVRNNIIGTTYNINSNADFYNYTNDIKITDLSSGDTIQNVTLDFRNNGSYVILREADKISFEINDDFTSINDMKVQVNGFLYDNSEL
jgi:hypothetical protein